MINEVLNAAMNIFLPYFTPIIFILLAVAVSDRLREMITSSVMVSGGKRRTD